jgi:hypothetical protein
MDVAEALTAGARIQTLRQCFNLREGIAESITQLHLSSVKLPFSGIFLRFDLGHETYPSHNAAFLSDFYCQMNSFKTSVLLIFFTEKY